MQVEASLRRLQTDWIDLYQMHCWDAATPLEETLSTLDDLVHEGKVRYIGASNYTGVAAGEGARTRRARTAGSRSSSLQPEYSLITRDIERELLPLCRDEGLGGAPVEPARRGLLTGKYREGRGLPERHARRRRRGADMFTYRLHEKAWGTVEAVCKVAAETGKTPAQVALNWVVHRPGVTAPIIGARNMTQLEDNLGAVGWQLEEEQWRALSWASVFPRGYPYDFIEYSDATH